MELITEDRNARLKRDGTKGLIIPVILRGKKLQLPKHIRNQIQFHDFTDFTLAKSRPMVRNQK